MRHLLALLTCAALACAVGCPVATASVGHIDESCDKYDQCGDTLVYRADPTERLDVRLSQDASAITIVETGTTPVAGPGCVAAPGSHELVCRAISGDPADLGSVEVYGGDVRNAIDSSGLVYGSVALHGGRGPDTILGGASGTTIYPGGGVDSLDGGPRGATVSFAGLRERVDVDLARHLAVGPDGMRVHLRRIEDVVGSDGNDKLVGDAHANRICGGRGRNLIEGAGGNDVLATAGPGVVVSGRGHSSRGTCGDPQKGHTSFVCLGSRDVVAVGDLASGPLDVTVGSHCESVAGFAFLNILRPMLLRLDAPDPARDRIVMALDTFYWPRRFDASLRASDGTVLGAVALRTRRAVPHVTLAVSPAGARYLRAHGPLVATLRIAEGGCAHVACDGVGDALNVRVS